MEADEIAAVAGLMVLHSEFVSLNGLKMLSLDILDLDEIIEDGVMMWLADKLFWLDMASRRGENT